MLIGQLIFYFFAMVLIASSLMVVVCRNPVHSALFLVLAFFASAAIWLFLESEFLALVLVLVYVGAVMTLFLFVVMMMDIDIVPRRKGFMRYLPLGILVVVMVCVGMVASLGTSNLGALTTGVQKLAPVGYSNIHELGMVLYTTYVYPFELAAILLLVSIIASVTLSLRNPRSKKQDVSNQLRVRKEDRLRVINMTSQGKD